MAEKDNRDRFYCGMIEKKSSSLKLNNQENRQLTKLPDSKLFKGGDTNSDDGDSVQATMTMLYYDEG